MGEELPVHKDPPKNGGDYPLMLTGGHTRWSIHSSWRDDELMLRQQRGVPVVFISAAGRRAARDRGRRQRARLQRSRRVRDHGQGLALGARGPAHHLPRLGELPVQERQGLPEPDPHAPEPGGARRWPVSPAPDDVCASSRATTTATPAWRSKPHEGPSAKRPLAARLPRRCRRRGRPAWPSACISLGCRRRDPNERVGPPLPERRFRSHPSSTTTSPTSTASAGPGIASPREPTRGPTALPPVRGTSS